MQAITSIDAMTQALAPQCYAYNIKTVMTILFKNVWYGPFRTKLEPFLANFEPYEKELHQHHFQRMVLYLSHKLRCYTGISGPEKSRNNTRKKISYFFTLVDIPNQLAASGANPPVSSVLGIFKGPSIFPSKGFFFFVFPITDLHLPLMHL